MFDCHINTIQFSRLSTVELHDTITLFLIGYICLSIRKWYNERTFVMYIKWLEEEAHVQGFTNHAFKRSKSSVPRLPAQMQDTDWKDRFLQNAKK
jgi:hypothetical protein